MQPTLQQIASSYASAGARYVGNLLITANVLLELMVFDNTLSANPTQILTYNYGRQKNMREAEFRAWYEDYTPGFAETEPVSTQLKPLGGAFEVDRVFFDADTGRPVAGVDSFVEMNIQDLARAARQTLNDTIINGDTAANNKEFDGLSKILMGSTSEVSGTGLDFSASKTDSEYLESLSGVKKYINRVKAAGLVPVILTNEDAALRLETVGTKLGFVQKRPSSFGDDITQFGGAAIVDLGDVGSTDGTGGPVIPTETGLTDIYVVGFGLQGFHGVTLSGSSALRYYSNLGDTNPGVVKRVEAELVATVALKNTKAAYAIRDVRIAPGA